MSNLELKIKDDLKAAMIAKNEAVVSTLRMLIASLRNKEIAMRHGGEAELTDENVLEVIKSEIKKRKESAEMYRSGNREDLAVKEDAEVKIFAVYLPPEMTDEELEKIIKETIDSMPGAAFGAIMGAVMPKIKGQADGGRVSAVIKKILS